MTKTKLLLMLVLLMTAATGAWAQSETSAKHKIIAISGKHMKSMNEALPYNKTVAQLYEVVMGTAPSTNLLTITGVTSSNEAVVSLGNSEGWNKEVSIIADGKAEVTLDMTMWGNPVSTKIDVTVVPPFYVDLKSGTKDAAKWTATVGSSTTAQSLPVGGLSMGDAVTLNYTGRLRVKKVTATAETATTPLTMEATSAGTIVVKKPRSGMQYSLNGGAKQTMSGDTYTIPESGSLSVGDKVAFYGDGTDITTYYPNITDYTRIYGGTATVKMYGNIMSLVDEDGFATAKVLTESDAFSYLFFGNDKLTDVSGLLLPATTLTERCYSAMFYSCTGLTSLPADLLPATTLANNCYNFMFFGCSNLTAAPELPAPTLADYCYWSMFSSCSKLASVTCLATNISASNCTTDWLKNVAATGTFTKAPAMTNWTTGNNGIPSGWTVEDAQ